MKNKLSTLLLWITLICISCEKDCNCDSVSYENTFETNYEWTETSREPSGECTVDTLSSTFMDNNGNISYVRTIIECD